MDSHKLAVKFFVEDTAVAKEIDLVPVFHRWIQTRALEGHQLIDVADYGHVPDGPGTVLVSHEANIYADFQGTRPGLLYVRKYAIPGSFQERLRVVFHNALKAVSLLQRDPSLSDKVRFRTNEAIFQINDRLNAPNTPETLVEVKGDLETFLQHVYGVPSIELSYQSDSERLFEVGIRTSNSVPTSTLLDRLATV